MRHRLNIHPEALCPIVESIEVEAMRARPHQLILRYLVTGDIGQLAIPQHGPAARRDELWMRTCFEAFVTLPGSQGYLEYNLSPSRAWAAYGFDGYRSGMCDVETDVPRIDLRAEAGCLELRAALEIDLPDDRPWQLGMSAVIETRDGARSWWALAHGEGPPDFHDRHCFVLELASPSAP